jgi:hypothetical protein
MSVKVKWIELKNIILNEVSQVQKDKDHVFCPKWEIDSNTNRSIIIYTCIYLYKYIYICRERKYVSNSGTVKETKEGKRRKE